MTEHQPPQVSVLPPLISADNESELRQWLTGTFRSRQYQYDAQGSNGKVTSILLELNTARCFVISIHAGPGEPGHMTAPLHGKYVLDGSLLRLIPDADGPHMLYQVVGAGKWGFQVRWCYHETEVKWHRVSAGRERRAYGARINADKNSRLFGIHRRLARSS